MRTLVQHILTLVSHPILNFLYRWIYDGELEDTYHEVHTYSIQYMDTYTAQTPCAVDIAKLAPF